MHEMLAYDLAIFRWMNVPRGPAVDAVLLLAACAGEYALIWWGLGALVLARRRRWNARFVVGLAGVLLLSVAATNAWKLVWFRHRPFEYLDGVRQLGVVWSNSAFPSGHVVSSFAAATLIGAAAPGWRPWLYGLAVLIAVSRPYCGMHHPSDVLVGLVMGLGLGRAVVWALWRKGMPDRAGVSAGSSGSPC